MLNALQENSVIKDYLTTASDGKNISLDFTKKCQLCYQ